MRPFGFIAKVHQLDAKVGGAYRMSLTNFGTGHSRSFGGTCHELVRGKRVRYTCQFEGGALPGNMPRPSRGVRGIA